MINPKELLEDFLALGYDEDIAAKLAKEEYKRRKEQLIKNNREAANKRIRASRTFID